ncbi:MAG: UDP-N-acetylglucosamine--N-acetylmuramyl-(pentapeptide) pyrophosphoryl-undecaprenol N-acetylglucosamine transferase, partial [Candidatus Brocadiaceae bacterium]
MRKQRENGSPRVAFAGGSSGGHLMPGVAVAEALRALVPGSRPMFLTTGRKVERHCGEAIAEFESVSVPATPWTGAGGKLLFPARCVLAMGRIRRLLGEFRPHAAVGLGGCNSIIPVLAARLSGVPTLLLEGNAVPGRAVRVLGPVADCVAVQWQEAARHLCARRIVVSGNPVRRHLFGGDRSAARRRLGLEEHRLTLLAMGGSQGALSLNGILQEALTELRADLQVLHLTGVDHLHAALRSPANERPSYRPIGFLPRIGEAYAAADFVLARSGASTLAELTALGLPSILVPYPWASAREQHANANILRRAGAAVVLDQSRLTAERLRRAIEALAADPDRLGRMSEAASRVGRP